MSTTYQFNADDFIGPDGVVNLDKVPPLTNRAMTDAFLAFLKHRRESLMKSLKTSSAGPNAVYCNQPCWPQRDHCYRSRG